MLNSSKSLTGILLGLVSLGFLAACEDVDILVNINLGVTPKEVTIPAEGGWATVSFNAPVAWEASSASDWLSLTPSSGEPGDVTLTLSAGANEATEQRSASVTVSVTVSDKKTSETVKVIQEGATPPPPPTPSLEVSNSSFNMKADGGEASLTITSNYGWTAAVSADWITLTKSSGEAGTTTIVVTGAKNDTYQTRRGTVTITSEGLTKTVTINQEAAEEPFVPTLDVSIVAAEVEAEGGNVVVQVTSNTTWTVSKDASWVSVSPAQGEGNGTVTITVQKNTATDGRVANVVISGASLAYTVVITQKGAEPDDVGGIDGDINDWGDGGDVNFDNN